jgi:hypothetical protein
LVVAARVEDVARGVVLDGVTRFAGADARGVASAAAVVGAAESAALVGATDSAAVVGATDSVAVVGATDAASVFAGARLAVVDRVAGVLAAVVFAVVAFAAAVLAAVALAAAVFDGAVRAAVVFVARAAGLFGAAFSDASDSADAVDSAAVEGRRGVDFRGALTVFSAVASGSSCSGGGGAELTQLTYQDGRDSACLEAKFRQIRPRKPLRGRSRVDNDIRHRLPLEGVAG